MSRPRLAARARILLAAVPVTVPVVLCCGIAACERPATPEDTLPRISILSPAAGSFVADTVCVRMDASDDGRLERVALEVDGATLGERREPPWEILWDTTALPDSSQHALIAVAVGADGQVGRSQECRVRVVRNVPPSIRILWPPNDHWIDLDRDPRVWLCTADDPDEGLLDSGRVRWSVDGAALPQLGCEIVAPALSPGPHEIVATARDHWDREATDRRRVHAFHYPGCATPAHALDGFLSALRARDPATAGELLSREFRYFPPRAEAPTVHWDSPREREALAALLTHSRLATLSVDGRTGAIETLRWQGREIAKIELHELEIRADFSCPPNENESAPESPERSWEVCDSAARIYLVAKPQDDETGPWRLLSWWDLHGALGCGGAAPSWNDLKESAGNGRVCD